jgi:hypothetical protein
MSEERKTPEGLPVVDRGTLEGLIGDINSESFDKIKYFDRMADDNPELAIYLGKTILLLFSGKDIDRASVIAVGMYELLRRQAESNRRKY